MNKPTLVIGLFGLALLVVGFLYGSARIDPTSLVTSNEEDASLRAFTEEFGSRFKNVSLLADDLPTQVKAEYEGYAAQDLLEKWQERTESAPGRYTSSPWPDRIEILSVEKIGEKTYLIEGNVIEVTSSNKPPEPAAVYPITLTIEKKPDGLWIVTSLEKGAYSQIPQRGSVIGYWECLPHRNTTGPQTLECAIGIAIDQSDGHYAVNTMLMAAQPVDFPTGTKVRVEGVIVPANQLSSDQWQKYDIDGIISATLIEKL